MAVITSAQQTIADITDAYSVQLNPATWTFAGTTDAAKPGSCTVQSIAMRGTDAVAVACDATKAVKPDGVTVTSDDGNPWPTFTVTVNAAVTKPGKVTLPLRIQTGADELDFPLDFTFGIAYTGATGQRGQDGVPGQPGKDGGTTFFHVAWANSADGAKDFSTSVANGKLYMGTYVDQSAADSTDPTKYKWMLVKGQDGKNGTPGTNGADGRTQYLHIAYANSADGQSGFDLVNGAGKLYIGQYVDFTEADSEDPTKYSWTKIKGDQGQQGNPGQDGKPGADAVSSVISSSNGLIFKNSRIDTTLTMHVYKAGIELTAEQIAALGTVKWYKDAGTEPVGTGPTIRVTADQVNVTATYTANLEK